MYTTKGFLHNIFVLKKAHDSVWDEMCEKHSLTRAEIDVLAFLANNPELNTARDIVKYRQIAKSHVSKAVDLLLGRGYLCRKPDDLDRRCMHLLLTDATIPLVEEIQSKQYAFAKSLLDGFTKEEIELFSDFTRRIGENGEKLLGE